MAELATIARPYAEALYKTGTALAAEVDALGALAADAQLQSLADSPKVGAGLVFNIVSDVLARQGVTLSPAGGNLLRAVIENGRMSVLPEIAAQYRALVAAHTGVFDARIESAFPIDDAQLAELLPTLEKRFARRLAPRVVVDAALIGGVRVTVGDEVLDTSVKARLERMKVVLTA